MKITHRIILFIIIFFASANAYAVNDINSGRRVIKQLQNEIREFLVFSDKELKSKTPEFRSDYAKIFLPNLKNISANISENAIKWIDIDNDRNPDLIFWTEGLAGDVEGVKEFLFAVDTHEKSKPKLILIHPLNPEPSKTTKNYEFSRFYSYPNQGRGYNNFLCGVFSYATFEANATNFINYEIFWNKFYNKIDVSEFYTSFPVAVEKVGDDESQAISSNKK